MSFYIVYTCEPANVLSGLILESRQFIAETKDKSGFQVYNDYIKPQIAKINENVLPYIVEYDNGSVAAFFSITVNDKSGVLLQKYIRPNYKALEAEISQKINSFIFNKEWQNDFLYGELK